jgi:hypothetical protein
MVCPLVKARGTRDQGEGCPIKVECGRLFWGETKSFGGVGN